PSLHEAQQAIASEYGQPTWPALKDFISGQPPVRSQALPHLEWVIARFADAGEPAWTPPDEQERRQHFGEQSLAVFPAGELVAQIASSSLDLHAKLLVVSQEPLVVRARI